MCFHIEPFVLPDDTQHNHVSVPILQILESTWYELCGRKTTPRRHYTAVLGNARTYIVSGTTAVSKGGYWLRSRIFTLEYQWVISFGFYVGVDVSFTLRYEHTSPATEYQLSPLSFSSSLPSCNNTCSSGALSGRHNRRRGSGSPRHLVGFSSVEAFLVRVHPTDRDFALASIYGPYMLSGYRQSRPSVHTSFEPVLYRPCIVLPSSILGLSARASFELVHTLIVNP